MHKDPAGLEVGIQEELAPWPVKHLNCVTREVPVLRRSDQKLR